MTRSRSTVDSSDGAGSTLQRVIDGSFDLHAHVGGDDHLSAIDGAPALGHTIPDGWTGASLYEVLSAETRNKALELVTSAREQGHGRPRQLNLTFPGGVELPIEATAARIDEGPEVLLLARSLQTLSIMQKRLVDAQQDMEREYWRHRTAETRYRTLFELTEDPLLLIDFGDFEILQANAATEREFENRSAEIVGSDACEVLAPDSEAAVRTLFERFARGEITSPAFLAANDHSLTLHLRGVELGDRRAILVRIETETSNGARSGGDPWTAWSAELLDALPDALVVLDESGTVDWANPAFLRLAEVDRTDGVVGEVLGTWFTRPGANAAVLLTTIADRRTLRLFRTTMTGVLGSETDVEVSGSEVGGSISRWVLAVRAIGRRIDAPATETTSLATRVSELSSLLGKVGLKDLVRTVGELVERHLIVAALETTGGNRTAAAELLMLSRQTLYTKLSDHGLTDES